MKPNYQCRRCNKLIEANPQPWTVRVICYWCGGTCDPTKEHQRDLNNIRLKSSEQRIRELRFSAGYGTNREVNKHNEVIGVTAKQLE